MNFLHTPSYTTPHDQNTVSQSPGKMPRAALRILLPVLTSLFLLSLVALPAASSHRYPSALYPSPSGRNHQSILQLPLTGVLISEFMASNEDTLLDEDGESADWIEIYNASVQPIELAGWSLTDHTGNLTKWIFPVRTLQPGEYLVVFASGKNRTDSAHMLHTNFKLASEGEYLALVTPDGTLASEFRPQYPLQSSDVSYGFDAAGHARYFTEPTPGTANSSPDVQGPAIADVQHYPAIPTAGESLLVLAYVMGNPLQVALQYRILFGAEVTVAMLDDGAHGDGAPGDGLYGVLIPHTQYVTGDLVRYAVVAWDGAGHISRVPAPVEDPGGNNEGHNSGPIYRGTVVDANRDMNNLPLLHWFVADPDLATKEEGTRASVFYEGRYYDNIYVRLRGGDVAATWPKVNFKFDFNPGDHFTLSPIATAPSTIAVEEFNLNTTWSDKSYMRQVLAWETYRDAGVPYSISFPVRVHQNGQFYSVAIFVEQPDERYLKRQHMDPDGALYKMYTPLTSPSALAQSDSAQKRTRLYEGQSDLEAFVAGLRLPDEQVGSFLFDTVDIPQVINYLAATVLMHDNDHVSKNYYLYRNSNTNLEWQMLPWDKDLTFGRNYVGNSTYLVDDIWADDDPYSHPLFGEAEHPKISTEWNLFIDKLYSDPQIQAMFLRRLRTLMDTQLQPPNTPYAHLRYESRIDELFAQMQPDVALDAARWPLTWGINQTFAQAVTVLKQEYLSQRRFHLYINHTGVGQLIPEAQASAPHIAFGPYGLGYGSPNEDAEYFTLHNPNETAVDISGWRVASDEGGDGAGVAYTFRPGVVIPAGGTLYVSPNVVAFRARRTGPRGGQGLFVQGDYSGRLSHRNGELTLYDLADTPVASLLYTTTDSDLASALRITELNYHPPDDGTIDGNSFEFIELQNVSENALELSNVRFVDGIEHTFLSTSLESGDYAVVVRNTDAFAARYGEAIRPAGTFTKNLSNSGERITLIDSTGRPIFSFAYGDSGLWPRDADGEGHTLVRTAPFLSPGNPCEWAASAEIFGSPGRAGASGSESRCVQSFYLPWAPE